MLARVLIVIVVVAVLGFFGTRGSEKVVAEVTERQELVDQLAKKVTALEQKNRELESQLAAQADGLARASEEQRRAFEQLHTRLTDMERREAAKATAAANAEIKVIMRKPATLAVNGDLRVSGPADTRAPLLVSTGTHVLTVNAAGRAAKYMFSVEPTSGPHTLIVDGTDVRASKGLALIPVR